MVAKSGTCIIVGAGIIGLAIGRQLAKRFQVYILDKHKYLANEASSRNSEVVHAGIYYPATSKKTFHCIRGKNMLYELMDKKGLPYLKCGKFIVSPSPSHSTDDRLMEIWKHAKELGVDLQYLNKSKIESEVPFVRASSGLYSPSTGIFNSHLLVRYLETQILDQGGNIQLKSTVTTISPSSSISSFSSSSNLPCHNGGYIVHVKPDTEPEYEIECDVIVNAAGLYADEIYAMIETKPELLRHRRIHPCRYSRYLVIRSINIHDRGHYYTLSPSFTSHNVQSLIYPVPDPNLKGLGIHLTIDMNGRIRVGPDAEYVDSKSDYRLDETVSRQEKFWKALNSYLKLDLAMTPDRYLKIDYVGIRSKLSSTEKPEFRDFIIEKADSHPNFINCIGIESPGLTSCLSIAQEVDELL